MIVHCAYDEMLSIEKVTPHPKNRNTHNEPQIERLSEIMKYQGWRYPINISKRSGYIVSGHGRLLAALKIGLSEVPVCYQDFESDEQEYANLVSDNSIASWAELDLSGINEDIGDLGPDFNIDLLGIKNFEIDVADKIPECDEDEVPEVKEPRSVLGDLYELGNHRLLCGDSTSIDAVEKLMNDEKADMVFTDPPYGVSFQSNQRVKTKKFDVIKNDEIFITEWINLLPIVSSGWVFIWTSWKVLNNWIDFTGQIGEMTNVIIWDKGGGGMGDLNGSFATDFEVALVFNRGAIITGKRIGSVWSVGKDSASKYIHPTQKPVALPEMAFENCLNKNDKVLDLFGGSGSTLIACEKTNRKCFMMELDPKYIDVIVSRYVKYTGNKNIKLNGEEIEWSLDV